MKTPILNRSLILAVVVTVCTQSGNPTFAQNNPRSGFRVIKISEFVAKNQIKVFSPKALAVQLFGDQEEQEGRRSEDISVIYSTRETSTIVHTVVGLADDSVGALRQRIELRRISNKWQIVWVGQQFKCQSGRGHQDWSGILCS